jgi:mRNA interferase RelE/StbE
MEPRFEILYHPDVPRKDLPRITTADQRRIRRAIEQKLAFFPQEFGTPLRHTLKGYWKLRVGDWRVIYKVHATTITILRIGHRREIYGKSA